MTNDVEQIVCILEWIRNDRKRELRQEQHQKQLCQHDRKARGGAMKLLFVCAGFAVVLSGCGIGGLWMNGDPSVGKNLKPYGAHWIEEGMTRESRRLDLVTCGSPNGEIVEFSHDQIAKARNPNEPNEIAAYLRLRSQVGVCMQGKGYTPIGDLQFLGGCDVRCLYP